LIDSEWSAIRKHLKKSKLSASTPDFSKAKERAVTSRPLSELHPLKVLRSRGYQYMLRTDVSRYFPTIYTHSLSWALHGKAAAKKSRRTSALLGNKLDWAIQRCQDSQTLGIPIGPDTSHIIAEIIGVALDVALKKDLGRWPAGFRFVDDYFLFFETQADAEQALAKLSARLREYELDVNFEKTEVVSVHAFSDDVWTYTLRGLEIAAEGSAQRASIHHYFDSALELSRNHPGQSVIKYALRRISKIVIAKDNWDAFEAQLLRAALAQPTSLQLVAAFLGTYARYGYALDRDSIGRVCAQVIERSAPLNHHSEVIWSLWICKELGIKLRRSVTMALDRIESACCKLVALDLESAGLLTGKLGRRYFKSLSAPEALNGSAWMLSYEAGRRKWAGMTDAHIRSHEHFKDLLADGICFYDDAAGLAPLFLPKKKSLSRVGAKSESELFDQSRDWKRLLDFAEPPAEYQDADSLEVFDEFDDFDLSDFGEPAKRG
jgi:hypothetical protein